MFKTLSLLVPMRGHPERREWFWDSFTRTRMPNTQLVVRVDDDDSETQAWAEARLITIVKGPHYDGYRSLPRFFNEMALVATGDLLMCGNDDMQFTAPGWDRALLKEANRFPDGIFNIGVYTFPVVAFPFSCVSRRLVDALGFLNDERLIYSDVFLRDLMARFGRVRLLPMTTIMHVGVADADAVQVKQGLHDGATAYWTLHEQCVQEAVERLKPLVKHSWWSRIKAA